MKLGYQRMKRFFLSLFFVPCIDGFEHAPQWVGSTTAEGFYACTKCGRWQQ